MKSAGRIEPGANGMSAEKGRKPAVVSLAGKESASRQMSSAPETGD